MQTLSDVAGGDVIKGSKVQRSKVQRLGYQITENSGQMTDENRGVLQPSTRLPST
jgi:hypothetical protein